MKKIDPDDFRVRPDKKVHLDKWPTKIKPGYDSQEEYQTLLAEHVHKLSAQQSRLYADNSYALLLIFQAMDAAGKDSAIKHVMSGVNPQGCQVFTFKHPTPKSWTTTSCGTRHESCPSGAASAFSTGPTTRRCSSCAFIQGSGCRAASPQLLDEKHIWRDRYRSIVNLEDHLHRNGTRIVKFFLHLSKEEQRKRFLSRIDEPEKNWKFSVDDAKERESWNHYMKAYEECLSATSTATAPWYVVPADDKASTRLIVSRIVLDAFKDLKLEYPKMSPERLQELRKIRKMLAD